MCKNITPDTLEIFQKQLITIEILHKINETDLEKSDKIDILNLVIALLDSP